MSRVQFSEGELVKGLCVIYLFTAQLPEAYYDFFIQLTSAEIRNLNLKMYLPDFRKV